jgi:hypothetical protein
LLIAAGRLTEDKRMTFFRWRWGFLAAALVAAPACITPELGSTDLEGASGEAQEPGPERLTGAIFTTTADGTTVNANQYAEKCDVYLNGGPEQPGAAGLPEGDYYFQVTSPPAGVPEVLLSTDDVTQRQFHVDASGRISGLSGAGDHATGENVRLGGVTVQLCPFADTPNPGCVYKVWVTPAWRYDLSAHPATFGFPQDWSKTDNFRVCPGGGEPPDDEEPPDDDDDDDEEEERSDDLG